MESGEERNEIPFDYAGRCYNATIRVDESRNLAPTKELTIEGIRQLLPEGEQTTVKAEAYYNSLYSERPVSDKVTIKVAKPKGEESASQNKSRRNQKSSTRSRRTTECWTSLQCMAYKE